MIIDTGASTSELGSPGQTSVVPPNQWSLRSTETFPDDLGAQQRDRDSVPESTIVYGYIYGEFIWCGSRVSYRMSRYFPHTFNVSYSEVRYSLLLYYVLLVTYTSKWLQDVTTYIELLLAAASDSPTLHCSLATLSARPRPTSVTMTVQCVESTLYSDVLNRKTTESDF